ncbi:SEC-C domain-containing protein [Halobacillus litoralis]|uniref:SEC-C metal-binding domain-containing protein n=1 Tax=Halobacillus litoralis TaxID=45668 RepID=UPI001CD40E92|nr:SEC-C metal-binding domain-containing protein [Halobacillus litoralis]MCA0971480.1 SEC-C domain-containing protein [Halobacillus litoralis]
MKKIGRNDPCPCGSGKKYKKCCGNNVVQFPSAIVKEELDQSFQRFQDYIVNKHSELLPEASPQSQEQQLGQFFSLLQGSLFQTQDDGTTIMEQFIEKEQKNVKRPMTKESLEAWANAVGGVFVLESEKEGVHVSSLFDGTTYPVMRDSIPLEDATEAPYYFGVLMQWGSVHQFIPIAIPKDQQQFDFYWNKLNEEQKSYEYFQTHLAEQFEAWLEAPVKEQDEQDNEQEQETQEESEVLTLLEDSVSSKMEKAWMSYYDTEQPNIRKPEVFAAALEFLAKDGVTKKATAEKHGVSPSSMSRRIKELENYM